MTEKQRVQYGLWPSPVSPAMQGAQLRLEGTCFDSDGSLVWLEALSGRTALMYKKGPDAPRDISGGKKIHGGVGYGGGDFTVRNGVAIFCSEQRLYWVSVSAGLPQPITPQFGECASPAISPDGSQVFFVHTYEGHDCLALANTSGQGWPVKLLGGSDFYMQPTWHPDGKQIAWIEWNHPQMPWDGTRLMLGSLDGSKLGEIKQIFGSEDIPVFQPEFSPDGRSLAFLANDGEWDSLQILDLASGQKKTLVGKASLMEPAWGQGMQLFAWSADSSRLFYMVNEKGWRTLWSVETATGQTTKLTLEPYTWVDQLAASPAGDKLALLVSSAKIPTRLVTFENGQQLIEKRSSGEVIPAAELPDPQALEWPAPDGTIVHGLYYPPTSTRYFSEGLPPAIVNIHGGPTSQRTNNFNSYAAYFCTRGYAVMEVNYRGSTGFGRSYMLKLREKWGLVDTEDAAGAAGALAALGLADPQRIVIMGGSSGGYTVLNALIQFPGVFKAGVNLYGVANLFDFVIGTHKFEERYNVSLVGPLPESNERYKAWSPVFHAAQIKDPVAVFQGAEDRVVPPDHSEQIVAALKTNGGPYIYRLYQGEGHGFRKTETIIDFYEHLEMFLKQHVLI